MLNEHEIREKIHILSLEILEIAGQITAIHTDLLMRHFDDAKEGLRVLIGQAKDVYDRIPKEPGE